LLLPSLSDCLFLSLLLWLFATGSGWSALLADGDTGWHIRTGDLILDHGRLPGKDPFSFSRAGEPWVAWEWLADLLFAWLHRRAGLKGVVLLAGAAIALALTVLFRDLLRRGADLFAALAATLAAAGSASIHFLARPHVFTLLLLAVAMSLLGRDRRRPTAAVWLLVPMAALWANLHAGFVSLLACLAVLVAGSALEGAPGRARRYSALLAACTLSTLANPYGPGLHRHIAGYLRSDWIRQAVHEFQSPVFRSESSLQFEILLFAGFAAAGFLLRNQRVADALLILVWAHAALVSVRHIPVFAIVSLPLWVPDASAWWARAAASRPLRSVARIAQRLASDSAPAAGRTSLWAPLILLALAAAPTQATWPSDFPEVKFPVRIAGRHAARLAGARVFTSDQWGDYLIYRFHPRFRVFIDGRSDFYGPALGNTYLQTAYGHPKWRQVFDQYGFELVLAPPDWPLAGLLRRDTGWRILDEDARAVLFEKAAAVIPPTKGIERLSRNSAGGGHSMGACNRISRQFLTHAQPGADPPGGPIR
jgi:hypothetical protein